ncbi:MAG: polysaccharide deacetylase family protein [Candidatus Paceibacteria bacterium]
MIIELVGLPGAGKTTLVQDMKAKGAVTVPFPSHAHLVSDAILFWILRPVLAFNLLSFILLRTERNMRYTIFMNGYLGYAAQYHRARVLSRSGAVVVLDQGFFQLFLSLSNLPFSILKSFPRPDLLTVVVTDMTTRESRMVSRGRIPREELGTENRLAWQKKIETKLNQALPALEKILHIYQYDGTQDPETGATALMGFIAEEKGTFSRMASMRNISKISVALFSSLVAQIANIFWRSPQALVLMYHSVDRSGWKLSVSPEVFERQMNHLSKKGWTVPLVDIVSYAEGKKSLGAHAVAITFDDGYQDLLTTVLPILERYHIPATVFVPSVLSAQTDPSHTPRLNREELFALSKSPLITVGSHAKTHTKFTELSQDEMSNEAKESSDDIAQMLGTHPTLFAYPFGACSPSAEVAVKEAGYEAAFSISEGTIRQGDDLFRLKRVQIDGTMSFFLFRLRLTSAVDWNRRIVDAFRAKIRI